MLLPKRVKYRRVMRGRMKGKALRGNKVTYGDYGIQALEPAWITSNQIEAARVAMTRYIKRGGQVWIKIFPDKPVTEKPAVAVVSAVLKLQEANIIMKVLFPFRLSEQTLITVFMKQIPHMVKSA